MQGAETAVYAATSPSFSADKSIPLLLHDCKPLTPSVSGSFELAWLTLPACCADVACLS
jgi:hypothetical protein